MANNETGIQPFTSAGELLVERARKAGIPVAESADDAQMRVLQDILGAEETDEVLGGPDVVHAKEVAPVDLRVHRWRLQQGDLGYYAVIEATLLPERRDVLVTCGAPAVVAALLRLTELGALPATVRLDKTTTRSGYDVLRLRRPSAAVVVEAED